MTKRSVSYDFLSTTFHSHIQFMGVINGLSRGSWDGLIHTVYIFNKLVQILRIPFNCYIINNKNYIQRFYLS